MKYSFELEDVKVLKCERAAMLLSNIRYWCLKNKTNRKNFFDGKYWTYNSSKAFAEQFPWLTSKQIERSLSKLIEFGAISKGCYNENKYDRTAWYSCNWEVKSILQKEETHFPISRNGSDTIEKSIHTDNKPYHKQDIKESHSPIGSFDTSGEKEKKERQEKHHSNFEENPIHIWVNDETSAFEAQKKEKQKLPIKRKRKTAEEKQAEAINEHWAKVKGLGRDKGEAKKAFMQVWDAYDKKNYHKAAINEFTKYWRDAKEDTSLDELIAHINRYVKSTPEKQYRRNLSNYLSEGMYLYPVQENVAKNTIKSDKPISLI